jgi:polar amino acid transport system substrate-binding protein
MQTAMHTGWIIPILLSISALCSGTVSAEDTLDRIRQRGTLRWGADQEGGGPYVYPRSDDPSQVTGFEVEIADLLAHQFGVKAEFVQGQWDKLPDLMERGDIDIVLNGYEWTPNRHERYGCSVPYYLYELQLLARRDSPLRSIEELSQSSPEGPWNVGVLGGTAAEDYLASRFPNSVHVVSFDGPNDAMRGAELQVEGLHATFQDLPVVAFSQPGFPGLKRIGPPVGLGYYVVLTRKSETLLLKEINTAIRETLADGRLRLVLSKYDLWNATQAQRGLETDASGQFSPPQTQTESTSIGETMEIVRGWAVIGQRAPLLLLAALLTVLLSVISMPLAVLLGLGLALGRMHGPWPVARLCTLYVEVVRGTPLVLQLYVIFFVLPEIHISIHSFWAGVLGLAINYSAYESEIYRAGIQAIPKGQTEAALALGMSRWLTLRRIIIPQATRIVIPPMTNDFIALFKDTAVCSVITVVELSKQYYIQARSTGAILELGVLTAILYLAMSYPLSLLAGRLERQLRGGTGDR